MELKGSKTEKNLLAAFAGESQARMRYTFFACAAKKAQALSGLPLLSQKVAEKGHLMEERLGAILSSFEGKEDDVIPLLQQVQKEYGYLTEEAMLEIARYTRVPDSRIFAVASFYAQFRFTPIGRNHVLVCRGTACHVRGGARILEAVEKALGIKEGETSKDMEYSLETVACIGCCGLPPTIMMNKKVHGKMTPRKVAELFARSKEWRKQPTSTK